MMYIPPKNQWQDKSQIIKYMHAYAFATLVNMVDGRFQATHLPFLVKTEGEEIYLQSHLAKLNPQGKVLASQESLVIFSGAHAYISPHHYERKNTVPTWDYVAVHAYTTTRVLEESPEAWQVFEDLMRQEDPEYFKEQWGKLPENYKKGLFKGTVPFIMKVNRLEAKAKLSQDKTEQERQSIIKELGESPNTNIQTIAKLMSDVNQ